jgi:hypothetical protein
MLFSVLAFVALSFDLGILFVARTEAQRAADAGALAGASAYIDIAPALNAVPQANSRALLEATRNFIRNTRVDTPSVQVLTDHSRRQVWVEVRREHVPMWFGRFLGLASKPIKASASAHASPAGGVTCMRALAIPDHWHDNDNDTNGDWIWDHNEAWQYDQTADDYAQFGSGGLPFETGWGSAHRDNQGAPLYTGDRGRRLIMKPQDPNLSPTSGFYYPLDLGPQGGGANQYLDDMTLPCHLNPNLQLVHNVGDVVNIESGNMVGPTTKWALDLYNQDPGAQWDALAGDIVGSAFGNPKNSPRMVLLGIFEPAEMYSVPSNKFITIKEFAYFFVEGHWDTTNGTVCTLASCKQEPVVGRFMYYAVGAGSSGPTGNLVLQAQLIK